MPLEPNSNGSTAPVAGASGIRVMIAAKVIETIMPVAVLILLLSALLVLLSGRDQWTRALPNLVALTPLLVIWWMVRAGRIVLASYVFFGVIVLALLSGMVANGGVMTPSYGAFIILIVVSTWFFGRGPAIAITAAVIGTGGIFVWLAYQGFLREAPPLTPLMHWLLISLHMVVCLIATVIPNQMLYEALADSETRRAEAEQARQREEQTARVLAESEKQYRLLADNATDVIWTMDLEGNFTYMSPSEKRLSGFTVEDAMAKKMADLLPPDSLQRVTERLTEELKLPPEERSEFEVMEVQQYTRDGSIIDTEVAVSWVRDEAGEVIGLQGVTRDISDRKRAETEKAQLEEQLRQSQKIEAVGQLAGGIAHDLNNLLTPILGYSELLGHLPHLEGRPREALEQISLAGLKARDLVGQLLAFSRKQTLEFNPVDLNAMIGGFEKLLRRAIREDITIEFTPAPSLPPVQADAGQLEQVLMNLAVNAQDAMPGGGRLTLATEVRNLETSPIAAVREFTPGPHAVLTVSDNGCGMSPSVREHIFEPFFSTKGVKGTGLGLATSYGIVKQHNGFILVESRPDQGTTFTIFLPVTHEAAARETPVEKAPSHGGSETILLAEDNHQVREIVHDILSAHGYSVVAVGGGLEALAELERDGRPVSLLLTDVVMPELSGKELYERAVQVKPGLKVLYMSGHADDVIAHRGILEQGTNFIQKPFSSPALLAKLREALDE